MEPYIAMYLLTYGTLTRAPKPDKFYFFLFIFLKGSSVTQCHAIMKHSRLRTEFESDYYGNICVEITTKVDEMR